MMKQYLLLSLLAYGLLGVESASAAPRRASDSKSKSAQTSKNNASDTAAKAAQESPILKHEKFPGLMELLNKQVEENSANYGPSVEYILETTGGDEKAVKEWMNAAAQRGNAAAERWMLGQILSDIAPERLLAPEIKEAYRKLEKLSQKGFVPAILDVSACQRMGIGTIKDEAASLRSMMEACKSGDFLARYQWLLATKRLTSFADKDKPEIASEITRGNHYVIYRLSAMAPNSTTQLDWIKKAAEKGSGEAYFALASLTSASHPKESLMLLRDALRLYYPDALYVMASALMEENPSNPFVRESGLTPNPEKGRLMLKTAAMLGNVQACLSLANGYYDGAFGLPKDPAMAYFHFSNPQIASGAASAAARGLMLLQGTGVPQDTAKGLDLLKRADAAGYPYARILMAYAHYKGIGVPEDAKLASDLLSEAAALGSPVAYVYLAYITAKGGKGLPADVAQGKRYIQLAAIDMGDKAQQLYDSLVVKGDWEAHP